MYMINFKDLETKGYVIIPKFFSIDFINTLIVHYRQEKETLLKNGFINKNYNAINSKHHLNPYLYPVLNSITQSTNITVNVTRKSSVYIDNQLLKFNWHQDHEPYYIFQDMYNAVSCWIPMIKPSKNKSGLGIIPQDVLASKCPEIFKTQLLGKGAKRFDILDDNTTLMTNDDIGGSVILPFNIEELGVYPEVSVGDLLIFRQDVIHQTQQVEGHRVAVSVRCLNKNTVLTKEHFINGPESKKNMINNNLDGMYLNLINKFITEGRTQILISDLI